MLSAGSPLRMRTACSAIALAGRADVNETSANHAMPDCGVHPVIDRRTRTRGHAVQRIEGQPAPPRAVARKHQKVHDASFGKVRDLLFEIVHRQAER